MFRIVSLYAVAGIGLMALLIPFVGPLMPGKHIYTEIEIAAPPDAVWRVLADTDRYGDWNPYHVRVEGEMTIGAPLVVHVEKPNGESVIVKPHLLRIEARRELTWGGGIPGIFYGEHVFRLDATPRGTTRLIHQEDFTGIFVSAVRLDAIDEGYAQMNEALKAHVEASRFPVK